MSSKLRRWYRRFFKGSLKRASDYSFNALILAQEGKSVRKVLLKLSWLKILRYESEEVIMQDIYLYLKNKYGIERDDIIIMVYCPPGTKTFKINNQYEKTDI